MNSWHYRWQIGIKIVPKLLLAGMILFLSPRVAGQVVGPLVINPISDTNILFGTTISITASVTNTLGLVANSLLWTLPNGPSGANITNSGLNTALLTWTPSAAQSQSTNPINVQVLDQFNPTNNGFTSFRATVFTNAIDSPPQLDLIDDTSVAVGTKLTLTATAHTTDGTTNTLAFSLDPDSAPTGASITPGGVFTWTPTIDQAGDSTIGVIVTENTPAALSDTQFFTVSVILTNNCAGLDDFIAAVTQGGDVTLPDCPIIVLSNTLVVTSDVTIDAGDTAALITGNNLVRLFTVQAPATLTLSGVTLFGGQSTNGGAIFVEEGATLVISNCIFGGNTATGSNGADGVNGKDGSGTGGNGSSGKAGQSGYGGAIYNAGDLTISASQFLTNRAVGSNGGNGGGGGNGGYAGGNGGGGGNGGSAFGAAIYTIGSPNLIQSCSFVGNSATSGSGGTGGTNGSGPFPGFAGVGGTAGVASGAGLYSTMDATVTECTFSQNTVTGGNSAAGGTLVNNNGSNGPRGGDATGGGIWNSGTNTVINCTFFGNSVTGGHGGDGGFGNYNGGNAGNGGNGVGGALYSSAGDVSIVNCTIAQNSANGGTNGVAGNGNFSPGTSGSPGAAHGAGVARAGGTFFIQNSILMTNLPGTNAYGTMTDGGTNLSSDASLKGASRKNIDSKLSPLAGDPPQIMALLSSSPAIDAADDSVAPDTDEVGTFRPVGPHSDIGAYEFPSVLSPQITSSPADQTVALGSTVTLKVSATGDPPLIYRWQFNGATIAGATKSVYGLSNAQLSNAGPYVVYVSNHLGVATSSVANLTVSLALTISGHVFDGTNALSDVTVGSGTNLAVTDVTGNYIITNVFAGDYFVFASNSNYNFGPAQEIVLGPTGPSASNINFSAAQPVYLLSGQVLLAGAPLSGVQIFLGRTTDSNGAFQFSFQAGSYVLTPFKVGYSFRPASLTVTLPPATTNIVFQAGALLSITPQPNGTVVISVSSYGSSRLEVSTNLVNWVSIYTNRVSANNDSSFSFTNNLTSESSLFYRAVQQ